MTFLLQGRPGVNGYKGEKGESGAGAGYGYPVSIIVTSQVDLTVTEIHKTFSLSSHF